MNTPKIAPSASVPEMVQRGLRRASRARSEASAMRTETSCEIARKLGRVAELYDREARWWEVLVDWTYTKSDLCTVFGAAAIAAKTRAEESAKEYRRLEASYWQRATAVAADSGVAA